MVILLSSNINPGKLHPSYDFQQVSPDCRHGLALPALVEVFQLGRQIKIFSLAST